MFFKDCKTLNEVKALYRSLCKEHHPDRGGNLETMQAVNVEYAKAVAIIARGEDLSPEEIDEEILNAEQYQQAVNAIINLEGINIEICGGWIWVTGNTYQHREIFKQFRENIGHKAGFFYASKKVAWYFRSPEFKSVNRKALSLDQIRNKYGSHGIGRQPMNGKYLKAS